MCNSLFYDSNYAKRSSKYGREDGNYFSDFHRKLAEISFNWGVSMHKYLFTPRLCWFHKIVPSPDIQAQCVNVILLCASGCPSSISIPGILATTHIYSDRLKPNRLPNGLFCSRSHAISECIIWIMLPFLSPQASGLILKLANCFLLFCLLLTIKHSRKSLFLCGSDNSFNDFG